LFVFFCKEGKRWILFMLASLLLNSLHFWHQVIGFCVFWYLLFGMLVDSSNLWGWISLLDLIPVFMRQVDLVDFFFLPSSELFWHEKSYFVALLGWLLYFHTVFSLLSLKEKSQELSTSLESNYKFHEVLIFYFFMWFLN
jgi:hypothetical protein